MISNALKTFLCWIFAFCVYAEPDACVHTKPDASFAQKFALFLQSSDNSENPSVELQLLGVHLGAPYIKTKKQLAERYGDLSPTWSVAATGYDLFLLDKQAKHTLVIIPDKKDSSIIGTIRVDGTEPLEGLNFFSGINLGESENHIFWRFPKVNVCSGPKEEYRRYVVPFSNYSIETKNGRISSLRIQNEYTRLVKSGDDSIALTENLFFIATQKGYLKEPIAFDKLTALVDDPLRPFCQSRCPLRLGPDGSTYVDVSIFQIKDGKLDGELVPGTFLLDTGYTNTGISPDLCQKMNCKRLEGKLSVVQGQKISKVSGGNLTLGKEYITTRVFDVLPPTILKFYKGDGVLGGDMLLAGPLFVNFKHGYLCFPSLPIAQVAKTLAFKKFNTDHEGLATWATLYLNGQLLKRSPLDSGAYITSLTKEEIARLKLKQLPGKKAHFDNVHGLTIGSQLYGPVEIGWPQSGVTQVLEAIAEDPKFGYSIIGVDFLRHYILGLDLKLDVFYLGE